MNEGSKFAIGILILFLAMVAFFFAFHPNNVKNPQELLQWIMGEFGQAETGKYTGPDLAQTTPIISGPGTQQPPVTLE